MAEELKKARKSVKDEIKAGVVPTKKKKAKTTTTKKASTTVDNQAAKLVDREKAIRISAKSVGETKPVNIDVADIKTTSHAVYVDDIHTQNPTIMAEVYWIIMPNTSQVVMRISEKQYNDLRSGKYGHHMNHLYSVINMGVFPSLTYGSWKADDIDGLPTKDQIAEYDRKFRTMDVQIHNQPVVAGEIKSEESSEEEEFELDFGDDGEEEDAFDFSEE